MNAEAIELINCSKNGVKSKRQPIKGPNSLSDCGGQKKLPLLLSGDVVARIIYCIGDCFAAIVEALFFLLLALTVKKSGQ